MKKLFNNIDLKKSVFIPGILLFVILFLLNSISQNWFHRWGWEKVGLGKVLGRSAVG